MPPGIYCEDEAAYRALLAGARAKGQVGEPGFEGVSLGGMRVYVATPEQAALLRAMPAQSPAEALAQQQAAFDAAAAQVNDLIKVMPQREHEAAQAVKGDLIKSSYADFVEHQQAALEASVRRMVRGAMTSMSGEEWGRRFMGHAQAGMNRAARRAAAAQARRS